MEEVPEISGRPGGRIRGEQEWAAYLNRQGRDKRKT